MDFAPIEVLQREAKWEQAGEDLAFIGKKLEAAGVEGRYFTRK
ncbi:aspartate/glutamate racemase [Evansella vedderi]|uniref:Aspartate/glutamate racemase n=1 Tax=Evansella vedderi TaxID=38282 RepID=A0ABU0A1G6_9BACI|nr:hypothetical protein [Evansella vedderi]MDQ0257327.1 aspartate/glutamate racemase [Evansella vedderi]